ncbi:uncharacterized protein [Aegilops tauschii subsp. strangulata]|uniref:uncharacterized protein n=1 Tax=Aegilops tauschii subsp. strangulata TaxID=200361 RepID=UPI003CC8CC6C
MGRREIMDPGSGGPKKILDPGSGKPMEIIGLGSGKLEDYPCVRQLRNRRLLTYLWLQGFDTAYDSVVHESDVQQMSRLHLRQLVVWGQWREAVKYINRFLPPADDRGVETRSLLLFLHTLWSLANVAACSAGGFVNDSVRRDLHFLTNLSCRNVKLNSILQYTLHSPQFTASLDWKLVREKASLIADDWALETPELRRKLQLPGGRGLAQDLLPIGPLRPRRHRRQQFLRPKPVAIAKGYLNRRRSLPSSSPLYGLPDNAISRVADLIDALLITVLRVVRCIFKCPPDATSNELVAAASGTPLLQAISGTVTNPAKNTGTSSVTNEGAPTCTDQASCPSCSSVLKSGEVWQSYSILESLGSNLAQMLCPSDATSNELVAAASGTPLLQAISGTLTNPAENTGTSSVTNEGAPTCTDQPSCSSCSSVAKSGEVF